MPPPPCQGQFFCDWRGSHFLLPPNPSALSDLEKEKQQSSLDFFLKNMNYYIHFFLGGGCPLFVYNLINDRWFRISGKIVELEGRQCWCRWKSEHDKVRYFYIWHVNRQLEVRPLISFLRLICKRLLSRAVSGRRGSVFGALFSVRTWLKTKVGLGNLCFSACLWRILWPNDFPFMSHELIWLMTVRCLSWMDRFRSFSDFFFFLTFGEYRFGSVRKHWFPSFAYKMIILERCSIIRNSTMKTITNDLG